jgi:glycosyltransferase involved in cell wall biosynthesis
MNEKVAVLIPAHNESNAIEGLLKQLKRKFSTVIVVDDGSQDGTGKLARENAAVVLTHRQCMGKGAALQTGFRYILENDIPACITMDADGQHLAEDTDVFLNAYKKRPYVGIWVGKRKIKASNMPPLRRITNVCMSSIISFFSCQWIPDTQCGYRLITREVLEKIHLCTTHFEAESEMLIKASWKGFRISSVLIQTVYRNEKSKIRPLSDTLRFFLMIIGCIIPFSGKFLGDKK